MNILNTVVIHAFYFSLFMHQMLSAVSPAILASVGAYSIPIIGAFGMGIGSSMMEERIGLGEDRIHHNILYRNFHYVARTALIVSLGISTYSLASHFHGANLALCASLFSIHSYMTGHAAWSVGQINGEMVNSYYSVHIPFMAFLSLVVDKMPMIRLPLYVLPQNR